MYYIYTYIYIYIYIYIYVCIYSSPFYHFVLLELDPSTLCWLGLGWMVVWALCAIVAGLLVSRRCYKRFLALAISAPRMGYSHWSGLYIYIYIYTYCSKELGRKNDLLENYKEVKLELETKCASYEEELRRIHKENENLQNLLQRVGSLLSGHFFQSLKRWASLPVIKKIQKPWVAVFFIQ